MLGNRSNKVWNNNADISVCAVRHMHGYAACSFTVRRSDLKNLNLEIGSGKVGNKAVDTALQASAPCSSSNVPSLIW
jgi:hypothetical protein